MNKKEREGKEKVRGWDITLDLLSVFDFDEGVQ